jgi:hypothetical protein
MTGVARITCFLCSSLQANEAIYERDQLVVALQETQEQLDRQTQHMDALEVCVTVICLIHIKHTINCFLFPPALRLSVL